SLSSGQGWQPGVEAQPSALVVRAFEGATPFRLRLDGGQFTPKGAWWWGFHYREETARGLDDRGDLYAPGVFTTTLAPGAGVTLVPSAEAEVDPDSARALAAAEARQAQLLQRAGAERAPALVQHLVLAADQFVVARAAPPVTVSGTGTAAPP